MGNRRIDALKSRAEKVAPGQTRHVDELTALPVIHFERHRQVNPVIHLEGDVEREVTPQLLRQSQTGLNCIRVIVVICGVDDAAVRLVWAWRDAEGADISFGESPERESPEVYAISPQCC